MLTGIQLTSVSIGWTPSCFSPLMSSLTRVVNGFGHHGKSYRLELKSYCRNLNSYRRRCRSYLRK